MAKLTQAALDAEHAAALYCIELEQRRSVEVGGNTVSGNSLAYSIRNTTPRRRRMIGNRLIRRFRKDTNNPTGSIDWNAFGEWLKENMLPIIKILLTILLMFI